MNAKNLAFYTGLSTVAATHLWLINGSLPDTLKNQHAYINIAAAALILWGST